MMTLTQPIINGQYGQYILTPGGKAPIPVWMQKKSMSIPGNRIKRMFDPPV